MRNLLFALLILLIAPPSFAGGGATMMMVGGTAAAGGTSYADILFYHSFETSGTCTSQASNKPVASPAACSGTPTRVADPAVETYGELINAAFENMYFTVNNGDIATHLVGRAGVYFKQATAWPTNTVSLWKLRYDASSNYIRAEITVATKNIARCIYQAGGGSTITLSNNTAAGVSAGLDNLALDTYYFLECAWDKNTPNYKMYINGIEVATDTSSTTGAWAGTPTRLYVGDNEGNGTPEFTLDQLIFSNSNTRDINAVKGLTSFPD